MSHTKTPVILSLKNISLFWYPGKQYMFQGFNIFTALEVKKYHI